MLLNGQDVSLLRDEKIWKVSLDAVSPGLQTNYKGPYFFSHGGKKKKNNPKLKDHDCYHL